MTIETATTRRQLHVLVSAYACSPRSGSEHAVGWGFIQGIAQHHDVCVIAEDEKCRADVQAHLAAHPELAQRVTFHFIQKRRGRLLRKIWPPSYYYFYRRWHVDAFNLAKRLHAERPFDIAHQLTMVGYREPGYLWQLGVPFVWGPVGGMGRFPWRYLWSLGLRGALYYTAYNMINAWQERFAVRPRRAASVAGHGLLSATPEDQAGAQRYWHQASHLLSEVGLPSAARTQALARLPDEPLRIVWSGLHIWRKALPLALRALAALPASVAWHLEILGAGPRTSDCKALAERLGIAERCTFHGWISREKALTVMASAHVMLITSLRDLTSTVTVEALGHGLPVVCLDHCGFSAVVDSTCGIKVPRTTPETAIAGLARAMAALDDESLRLRLAQGALVRAQDFAWARKADVIDAIYRDKMTANRP